MYWGSEEAGVEERRGQAVIESFKALSLVLWFARDFLLTLIQVLAVHMLLIWIFFFYFIFKSDLWLLCGSLVKMPKYCEANISLSCRLNVIMRWWSPSKRERRESWCPARLHPVANTAMGGLCRLCLPCGKWALLWCRAPQMWISTGMCPSSAPRAGIAMAVCFTSPVSSPKLATDRCSLPYCTSITVITSTDCRARNWPDQILH